MTARIVDKSHFLDWKVEAETCNGVVAEGGGKLNVVYAKRQHVKMASSQNGIRHACRCVQ